MDEVKENLGYLDDFVARMKSKIESVSDEHDGNILEWGDVYEHLIEEILEFLNVDFNQAKILESIAHSDRPWMRVKHGELKDIANLCWILEYVNRRDARNPALHNESQPAARHCYACGTPLGRNVCDECGCLNLPNDASHYSGLNPGSCGNDAKR